MFKITRIFTRPSASVPFFHEMHVDNELNAYMDVTYRNDNKLVSRSRTNSEDQLQCTVVVEYDTMESFYQFIGDTRIQEDLLDKADEYNTANNITSEYTTEEV